MRLGCFLIVITLALLIGGAQGLFVAATNRQPTVVSFEQFLQQKPTRGWFEIKGCRLDLTDAMYKKGFGGGVKDLYIPVHGENEDEKSPTHLLLFTKDSALLETMRDLNALDSNGGDSRPALDFLVKNRDRLFPKRDVKGMIQFGIDSRGKINNKLTKLSANLAPDFVILEDGKSPELGLSAVCFLAGVGLAAFLIVRMRSSNDGGTQAVRVPQGPQPETPAGAV